VYGFHNLFRRLTREILRLQLPLPYP